MSPHPIRVLIVDDSAVVRKLMTDALKGDPGIEVVGTAVDPYVARDKIKELKPDVLTLDLEMPRMDGLTFLRIIMEQHPMPVIIMSSLTQRGSAYALEALELGAFDALGKPADASSLSELGPQLIARIKATAGARMQRRPVGATRPPVRPAAPRAFTRAWDPRQLILLGASTGGTEALGKIFAQLPAGLPGIAVVQHIPAVFSKNFAARLAKECPFEVREAAEGDRLMPGLALIAPGNFHMMLQWRGDGYRVRLSNGPAVWHQRPAIDLLFKSAADCGAGPYACAGILTGMGKDGAEGLLRLRKMGAATFAQDEATSVVYGMPRVAWENGAAQHVVPLRAVPEHIILHHEALPAVAPSHATNA
jgi:two-component system, chemotaxis family, protein-glutamate methylesterase/glutaminase